MAPFYGWGSTSSRLEPLRGGSLLYTTKLTEIPGTHFIDLRIYERLSRPWSHPVVFERGTPGLGIQHPKLCKSYNDKVMIAST